MSTPFDYAAIAVFGGALVAMRAACVRRAEEYSIERLVARYAALYEELVPTHSA